MHELRFALKLEKKALRSIQQKKKIKSNAAAINIFIEAKWFSRSLSYIYNFMCLAESIWLMRNELLNQIATFNLHQSEIKFWYHQNLNTIQAQNVSKKLNQAKWQA